VKETPNNFVYISNGNIKSGEILLFSTIRVLNHLTHTEILESASLDSIDEQNRNIKDIISEEKIAKSIAILSYRYFQQTESLGSNDVFQKVKDF
jgi:hypothetical protein